MAKVDPPPKVLRTKTVLRALMTGAAVVFALSSSSGTHKLLKGVGYELKKARERERFLWTLAYLRRKKYIAYKENEDGTIRIVLTEDGKRKALRYNLDSLVLKKQRRWDRKWRLIAFDVPETKKDGRTALTNKMRSLGMISLQKSIWVWPYECKNEIDFVAEMFDIGPYVHYIVAESVTSEKFLKYKFNLF